MNHTPGPWVSDNRIGQWMSGHSPACRVAHEESHGMWAPVAMCTNQTIGDDQAIANAQLIAAAPDLLAACELALEEARERDEDMGANCWPMMRAAIAKAKVGTP